MKKKLLLVLAVCIVGTALTGCKKDEKDYTTFPKNYQIASVDVGGMTIEEAGDAQNPDGDNTDNKDDDDAKDTQQPEN